VRGEEHPVLEGMGRSPPLVVFLLRFLLLVAIRIEAFAGKLACLRAAVQSRQVPFDEVLSALEAAAAVATSASSKKDASRIVEASQWEIVFQSRLPGGYMPVEEIFQVDDGTMAMETRLNVGPLAIPLGGMLGSCKWLPAENALDFKLDTACFGPLRVSMGAKKESSLYYFQYFDADFSVARSSRGGLVLLKPR
jgi:hypothetical protein